jgi:prolipoprotein diacylglyceryltransferase
VPSVLALVPVHAVIELAFSPIVTIGDWNVRLETLALAAIVLACLLLAARIGRRTPADLALDPDAEDPETGERNHLRADDLLFIAVAALPGAVLAGRLGYVLLHLDYYQANVGAMLDIGQGGLELSLAIVGGLLTAAVVAGLLGAPVGRWMHALILPLLLAIAAGKLAMVLGGDGQGLPFDGAWALAFLGPGPWGSLAPALPSHPAQVYEAISTLAVLLVVAALLAAGAFRGRNGAAFLLGIALWAIGRAVVASTWRNLPALGSLNMGQVLALAVAAGAMIVLLGVVLESARRRSVAGSAAAGPGTAGTGAAGEPSWPDPETRPRI